MPVGPPQLPSICGETTRGEFFELRAACLGGLFRNKYLGDRVDPCANVRQVYERKPSIDLQMKCLREFALLAIEAVKAIDI